MRPDAPDADPLFAGLDVSTQSCKLAVIDPGTEGIVHLDQVDYDRDLPHYGTSSGVLPGLGEGISESDPNMWIEAVDKVLYRIRDTDLNPERIRCISVSGQQHGLVALTDDGRLARQRSKLWNDFSTAEECRILTEAVGGTEAMIREVGNTQRTGYTAGKILHMRRHESEAYERAGTFFLVHNFINWYLTGGPEGGVAVMEVGDASGMAMWHPGKSRWSRKVLDAIDPALAGKLPPILPPHRPIGFLAPSLATRFGLPPNCLIDAGCGDNMYGAVGTGNIEPGTVTVSLGTSGTAYTVLTEPFIDPTGEISAFRDSTGNHLPLVCVSNMANGYAAVRERFGLSHEDFDEIVLGSSPGNGGCVVVPWYAGERTPDLPHAAPLYFGFGLDDMEAGRLCRGVLEGHVLNLQDGVAKLPVALREIRVTGGLSASPAWRQAISDLFEADVVPVLGGGAVLGAAIHAAWVWFREKGDRRSLDEVAGPFIQIDERARCRPDPAHRAANRLLKRLYRSLTRRVRGLDGEDPFTLRRELLTTAVRD